MTRDLNFEATLSVTSANTFRTRSKMVIRTDMLLRIKGCKLDGPLIELHFLNNRRTLMFQRNFRILILFIFSAKKTFNHLIFMTHSAEFWALFSTNANALMPTLQQLFTWHVATWPITNFSTQPSAPEVLALPWTRLYAGNILRNTSLGTGYAHRSCCMAHYKEDKQKHREICMRGHMEADDRSFGGIAHEGGPCGSCHIHLYKDVHITEWTCTFQGN